MSEQDPRDDDSAGAHEGSVDDGHASPLGGRPVPRTQQLSTALVRAVGLDGAAVAMITDGGERDLLHATDVVSAHLDELQFTLAEGPCIDAHVARTPVLADDLTGPAARSRWPVFALQASAAGAAAAFAFPLVADNLCFGVIELYRRAPGALDDSALHTIDLAVEAVSQVALEELFGAGPRDEQPHSWPGRLSSAHAGVHQAAGMVAVHLDIPVVDALARLRADAYTRGTSLTHLAHSILTGRIRLEKDGTP